MSPTRYLAHRYYEVGVRLWEDQGLFRNLWSVILNKTVQTNSERLVSWLGGMTEASSILRAVSLITTATSDTLWYLC